MSNQPSIMIKIVDRVDKKVKNDSISSDPISIAKEYPATHGTPDLDVARDSQRVKSGLSRPFSKPAPGRIAFHPTYFLTSVIYSLNNFFIPVKKKNERKQ